MVSQQKANDKQVNQELRERVTESALEKNCM